LTASAASAQGVDGYVSLLADVFPAVRITNEPTRISELRARAFLERRFEIGGRMRITAAGFVEGLLADRGRGGATRAAIVRPQELHIDAMWKTADLRIGMTRVVWGRLDEFLPTDVVNPQDLTRFFLEGRTEGRMPVGMIRGRLLPSDRFTLEAIYVPVFRRGRVDEMDEQTSPFNLAPQPTVGRAPRPTGAQGGVRASVTTRRVDWSVSAYRGFEPLPLFEVTGATLAERFPRFTMIGGDFETVRGEWGVRGEIAAFVDRTLQAAAIPVTIAGKALEGGLGIDRKAGAYRISGNVVVTTRWAESALFDRTDVTLVAAVDRTFARETRTVRIFSVYNPGEASAFARVISTFSVRDDVAFEVSGGLFTGGGTDALSRLATRDFAYARLKVFF
jgi:hypothetical protein